MSRFDAVGTVTKCSRLRAINESDMYNNDPDDADFEGRLSSRFSTVSVIEMVLLGGNNEYVQIFLYDIWARQCAFINAGDQIDLSVSRHLARIDRRHQNRCVALHADEDGEDVLFIRVNYTSTCIIHLTQVRYI